MQFAKANAQPKIAKEYVFANAINRMENKVRKHNRVDGREQLSSRCASPRYTKATGQAHLSAEMKCRHDHQAYAYAEALA